MKLIQVAWIFGWLCLSEGGVFAGDRKPNVVVILADDLGYKDVGCYGSKVAETPNVDRLAREGVRLTNFHQCQNCAPTRASLMSGQYGARTGMYTVGSKDRFDWRSRSLEPVDNVTELPLDRDILAKAMKAGGYATGMFGKWHLGEKGEYFPSRRGFDEAIVSEGRHFQFKTEPAVEHRKDEYLADFLTDRAEDFIKRHRQQPFFLYLAHFGVHSPYEAKPELVEKYRKKLGGDSKRAVYAAMIESVDQSVGRILQLLKDLGLEEDTLLIFTSDNGGVGGYDREGLVGAGDVTDNWPLRSGKGSLYEGGTRVPMVMRWPGKLKAGTENSVLGMHVDLYPTLLEVSGAAKPSQVLDGESLFEVLQGSKQALSRTAVYQHFPGYLGSGKDQWRTTPVSVIYQGDLKLMEFLEDGHCELYDLAKDLGEQKNLWSEREKEGLEMKAKLEQWRRDVGAPMPKKNQAAGDFKKGGKKKHPTKHAKTIGSDG